MDRIDKRWLKSRMLLTYGKSFILDTRWYGYSSYQNYKNKALQNPEVKKEYDALQPEYEKALKDLKISENEKNSK